MTSGIWYVLESKKIGLKQPTDKRAMFIAPDNIWSIRSDRDFMTIETVSGETYKIRSRMKIIEELILRYHLPLLELSRSLIMNIHYLEEVDWRDKRTVIMKHPEKDELVVKTIGCTKWPEIEKRLGFAKVGT